MDHSTTPAVSTLSPSSRWLGYAIGLTPLWLQILFALVSPKMIGPMFPWKPPPVPFIGISSLDAVFGLAMILMVVGLLLIRRATSVYGVLVAIFTCTIPSLILTFFGTAIILVVKNAF